MRYSRIRKVPIIPSNYYAPGKCFASSLFIFFFSKKQVAAGFSIEGFAQRDLGKVKMHPRASGNGTQGLAHDKDIIKLEKKSQFPINN